MSFQKHQLNPRTKKEGRIMATVKGKKKTVTIWGFVGILVIMAWLLMPVTQAAAETKIVKYKVTNYITKMEVIPVFDVEGHVIGVFERRGVAILETGEVVAYLARGTFDLTKHHGPVQGYSQSTYKDGSTTVYEWQCILSLLPEWKLGFIEGEGKYTKGTGRFKGIKGTVSFTGRYITPYSKETRGDLYVEATSIYTLPSQ
jgi:hypothetical protein